MLKKFGFKRVGMIGLLAASAGVFIQPATALAAERYHHRDTAVSADRYARRDDRDRNQRDRDARVRPEDRESRYVPAPVSYKHYERECR